MTVTPTYNLAIGHTQILGGVSFVRGRGDYLYDDKGREYIDLYTNEALSFGHDLSIIRDALQVDYPINIGLYAHPWRARLVEQLAKLYPAYGSFQFYTSGTLANEGALRYASSITGRSKFIGCEHGYHGRTKATASLGNLEPPNAGAIPGWLKVPYPPLEGEDVEAGLDEIARLIDAAGAATFAGLLIEPVASLRVVEPGPGVLRRLRDEVLHPRGILLLADENFTSTRVGAWSTAVDQQDAAPDVITFSKCFSSGYPFAGLACLNGHVEQVAVVKGGDAASSQPMQCAIVSATIDALLEHGLLERTPNIGQAFLDQARPLEGTRGIVRVAARGAVFGYEFATRERAKLVGELALRQGVLTVVTRNFLRLTPSLTIPFDVLAEGVARIYAAVEEAARA
jgi:4-aminobutyrate aminotransferase-like enzyme